jgi:hypothetical protein
MRRVRLGVGLFGAVVLAIGLVALAGDANRARGRAVSSDEAGKIYGSATVAATPCYYITQTLNGCNVGGCPVSGAWYVFGNQYPAGSYVRNVPYCNGVDASCGQYHDLGTCQRRP